MRLTTRRYDFVIHGFWIGNGASASDRILRFSRNFILDMLLLSIRGFLRLLLLPLGISSFPLFIDFYLKTRCFSMTSGQKRWFKQRYFRSMLLSKISAVGTHGKKIPPLEVIWLTCFLTAFGSTTSISAPASSIASVFYIIASKAEYIKDAVEIAWFNGPMLAIVSIVFLELRYKECMNIWFYYKRLTFPRRYRARMQCTVP